MMEWLFFILIFFTSLGMTWAIRGYALHKGLMDIPNARSSHDVPTPRGGGLSFVVVPAIAVTIVSLFGYREYFGSWEQIVVLIGGGLWIAFVGFWDDHQHIPARWRLLAHFLLAISIVSLIGIPVIKFGGWILEPLWVGYLIFLFSLIWLINLFNFMDGIDGLAGVEAISVACGALLLLWLNDSGASISYWLGAVIAGVAGFLVWNWPPAKIFMGDVGSGFLGFFLGAVAIITAQSGDLSIWSWLILLGVFIVDATVTLIRRILNKEKWYEAHRSHAYQRLARRWNSHVLVTISVFLINLFWLFPLAWCVENWREMGGYISFISFVPLIMMAFYIKDQEVDSTVLD